MMLFIFEDLKFVKNKQIPELLHPNVFEEMDFVGQVDNRFSYFWSIRFSRFSSIMEETWTV